MQIFSRERCKKRAQLTPAEELDRFLEEAREDRGRFADPLPVCKSLRRVFRYPPLVADSLWVLIRPSRSIASVADRPRAISRRDPPI